MLGVVATASPTQAATSGTCTAFAAQVAAPAGMMVGPINDLNGLLPSTAASGGAVLVPAAGSTPSYCLVTGSFVTNVGTAKTANFGLALPVGVAWNGKYLQSGCGGFCGVVFLLSPDSPAAGFPANALAKGYAIAATDDGHSVMNGNLFLGGWASTPSGVPNTDGIVDFYYRAVHTLADVGKRFVQSWYGGSLARSYWVGCSDGGREGMVEADNYAMDFDGYIIGAPFFDIRGLTLGAGRVARATLASPGSYLTPATLQVVQAAVLASCDAADGVTDGLIQNPAKCSFSPQSLLCNGSNAGSCLTQDQVYTLTRWISASKDQEGRIVASGYPVSDIYNARYPGLDLYNWAESGVPPTNPTAPEPWPTTQPTAWTFYDSVLKYLVYFNANFDSNNSSPTNFQNIVSDQAIAQIDAATQAGSGVNPLALGTFLRQGRKMIMYHGFSDGFISPFRTERFYEDLQKAIGSYTATQNNVRLFMVPGMDHCGGGPGPNIFDTLTSLESWVESGVAPASILATKYTDDNPALTPIRSMPLCPFPAQAQFNGGDQTNAANWSCSTNQNLLEIGADGAAAGMIGPER